MGVYDLSSCQHTTFGGIAVPMLGVGQSCTVDCAAGRQRVGPQAIFTCPPSNTDPAQQPLPFAASAYTTAPAAGEAGSGGAASGDDASGVTGERSELPTCFEVTTRNPTLSPPQGIAPACGEAFDAAMACVTAIRRLPQDGTNRCRTKTDGKWEPGECQDSVDAMYEQCQRTDGWVQWQQGLKREVGKAGCGGARRPNPSWLALPSVMVVGWSLLSVAAAAATAL